MKRDAELDYRRIIFAWDQFKDEAEKAAAHLTHGCSITRTDWCIGNLSTLARSTTLTCTALMMRTTSS